MKHFILIITILLVILNSPFAQDQQAEIDSLIMKMRVAGREWNDYAGPLVKIGEPAVPGLIKNAEDKTLSQWNRRISIMTLNQIHSEQWIKPALQILFDRSEDAELRNHVIAGLNGTDLSHVKTEIWDLFNEAENQFHKSNLAGLLLTADTALAYSAFYEMYQTQDGHLQKNALLNLVKLRPLESTAWYIKGLQTNDWMTANMAMDSLIKTNHFKVAELISIYQKPGTDEELQWRIVFILGHRKLPDSVPFLVEAIQNKSWLVRNEAAVCLCLFNPDKVIPQMQQLTDHPLIEVQNDSRWVVQQLSKKR